MLTENVAIVQKAYSVDDRRRRGPQKRNRSMREASGNSRFLLYSLEDETDGAGRTDGGACADRL